MKIKTCTKCEKELPATLEYFSKKRKGLNSICKKCCLQYYRKYYQENLQKERCRSASYANKNADSIKVRKAKYYLENKSYISYRISKYQEKNKDIIKNYRKENRTHINKRSSKWRDDNPEVVERYNKDRVNEINESYVAAILGFPVKDIPIEIIEQKRLIIKLRRELKKM